MFDTPVAIILIIEIVVAAAIECSFICSIIRVGAIGEELIDIPASTTVAILAVWISVVGINFPTIPQHIVITILVTRVCISLELSNIAQTITILITIR